MDETGRGTVRGVGRKRQGLAHMQSGTVTDINAVVDNCSVALQEAEEMAGFRPTQGVIGIAGELVKGFTAIRTLERRRADAPITDVELHTADRRRPAGGSARGGAGDRLGDRVAQVDVRLVHAAVTGAQIDGYPVTNPVGFQGRNVKISIFNAFAPSSTSVPCRGWPSNWSWSCSRSWRSRTR